MSAYEAPLVLFTVSSQLSVGMVAVGAVRLIAQPEPQPGVRSEWLVAAGALLAGMIASVFHLGHPAGMLRVVGHVGSAWLSREALSVGLFAGLIALGLVLMRGRPRRGLVVSTALVGLAALTSMGMTYASPAFPAVDNGLPFLFFLLTAALLGSSVCLSFAQPSQEPLVKGILTVALVVGLVVYLAAPSIWLSGGAVMRQTGQAWLASPLHWTRIVVGLALPLAIILGRRRRPAPGWLWVLILAGELMGRAVFFANTVHTATNIGRIY